MRSNAAHRRRKYPMFTLITTERLVIRRLEAADLPALLAYRSDVELARYQSWEALTPEQGRALIAEMAVEEPGAPGGGFQFAVALRAGGGLIGDVFFKLLDHDERQGEIGYTLARAYHGRGYATEAVRAVLGYAFEALGLHRVIAQVDCANTPSVALLERLGMRREGHFLQHYWQKGAWRDEYLYAMLQADWFGHRRGVVSAQPPSRPDKEEL